MTSEHQFDHKKHTKRNTSKFQTLYTDNWRQRKKVLALRVKVFRHTEV